MQSNEDKNIQIMQCSVTVLENLVKLIKANKVRISMDEGLSVRLRSMMHYQHRHDYNRTLSEAMELYNEVKAKCQK